MTRNEAVSLKREAKKEGCGRCNISGCPRSGSQVLYKRMEYPHDHAAPGSSLKRFLVGLCLALVPLAVCAAEKPATSNGMAVHFSMAREGYVMVNIYNAEGTLVRRLEPGRVLPKGAHDLTWDGLSDAGKMVEPGEFTWKGLFHEGIGLKLRGWVGSGPDLPWRTADGKGGWGGDRGVPSAVSADDTQVYLGWSLAEDGNPIVACDPGGHVVWRHRRSEGASGCKALAVDDGLVYVLGGLEQEGAEGKAIYRLNVKDGQPVAWPNGSIDLKLFSFWPADGKTKPDVADAMSVRNGHIYLSFTNSQFLTVLDARTGEYLQTVVGAPPGMIDIAPTQTELPTDPGKLADADLGVIAIRVSPEARQAANSQGVDPGNSVLGRILFAHDPFWVVTSDMAGLKVDAPVTALSVVGERAKFHRATAFAGFGAPVNQIEARPLLDAENTTWVAGRSGGRALLGSWQPDGLRSIRGIALAPDGKLWVAESDAYPKRFSVWDTTGRQGKLVREFFGPMEKGATGSAINPLDPDVMFAQGCEWRIDQKTGVAKCLGVVTREPVSRAQYGIGKNGHAYLITQSKTHPVDIFERVADGQSQLRTRIYYVDENGNETTTNALKAMVWVDENGDGKVQENELSKFEAAVPLNAPAQDLSFIAVSTDLDHGEMRGWCRVSGWSACGAPRYDLKAIRGVESNTTRISADGRWDLFEFPGEGPGCENIDKQRPISWQLQGGFLGRAVGSALLPPPVKNVWVLASREKGWRILNEDGFDLGRFFESDEAKVVWPKIPAPGADMTHATAAPDGSVAQTAAGKVYLSAGDSAQWNLEVTGLEKVKALPGGKITVPTAK